MIVLEYPYHFPDTIKDDEILLLDHLDGFDSNLYCRVLDHLNNQSGIENSSILYHQILEPRIRELYPNLNLTLASAVQEKVFHQFENYREHPVVNHSKFLCTFNQSPHVGRKILVSILHRFGWFDPQSCSKNFAYSRKSLDGIVQDYVDDVRFYLKFFLSDQSEDFFQSVNVLGVVSSAKHDKNIYSLEKIITTSFVHIVSEAMATSYYPFVTEKFLYSVVTRGLFLSYAQPGWHDHLEKYYGFKKYDKIFNYRFDAIQNPVERLVELMSMISKFSVLSHNDWKDLYDIEQDTIEYNYDWYFGKHYLKHVQNFCST